MNPDLEPAGVITSDEHSLVVIGWDLQGTAIRRLAWRRRALAVWAVTALPGFGALAWFAHPMLAVGLISSATLPFRPELLAQFRWGRPGTSCAWYRIRATPDRLRLDHLYGFGCPPAARVLDPTPSVDSMKLTLPNTFDLAWSEVGSIEVQGEHLCIGPHRIHLGGVSTDELIRIRRRLQEFSCAPDAPPCSATDGSRSPGSG